MVFVICCVMSYVCVCVLVCDSFNVFVYLVCDVLCEVVLMVCFCVFVVCLFVDVFVCCW